MMKTAIPLYVIAIAVIVIALQNAGIIAPFRQPSVKVSGRVNVDNTVDVDVLNVPSVRVDGTVDVQVENSLPISVEVDNPYLPVTVVR